MDLTSVVPNYAIFLVQYHFTVQYGGKYTGKVECVV